MNSQHNREPRIFPAPSEAEIKQATDDVIGDDEKAVKALIEILYATANFDEPAQANLAAAVIDHAYSKTRHCEARIEEGLRAFTADIFAASKQSSDFAHEKSTRLIVIG